MAGSSQEDNQPILGINVTPLVDVVLVLLIIFMVAAPLMQKKALNINVPKVAHTETKATEALQVFYGADRTLYIEKQEIPRDALAAELKRRAQLDPALRISVSADQSIPYGDVVALLDQVRDAGITKVALDVSQKGKNE